MGSNLLIVMSGATTSGGAHGGFGSHADADLGRPARDPARGAGGRVRGAAAALERAGDQRGAELDHHASPAPRPTTSRSAAGRGARARCSRSPTSTAATKVVVLGQTVVDKLFGPSVDPRRAERAHPATCRSRWSACWRARGSRRWGRTTTTPCSSRRRPSRPRSRAACKKYLPASIMVSASSQDATARAERQVTALLRDRHHLARGADDDFSIRNLTEMAARAAGRHPDADHPARQRSRRCRCWSAASAS